MLYNLDFLILQDFLINREIEFYENYDISKISPIKIGANARFLIYPHNENELVSIVDFLLQNNIRYIVAGKMSNILMTDSSFLGAVIRCNKLDKISITAGFLTVECGFSLHSNLHLLASLQIGGLEPIIGIPGCIGGMISMNAGAYGMEIADILHSVKVYDPFKREILKLGPSELDFGYRSSKLKKEKLIVLEATFSYVASNRSIILRKAGYYSALRKEKQPIEFPNLGSVFKRPNNGYAGELIEKAGLKGYRVGGAQVSEKHAGFIVNTGNATSQDVTILISIIRQKIKEKFGIDLQIEIEII